MLGLTGEGFVLAIEGGDGIGGELIGGATAAAVVSGSGVASAAAGARARRRRR